MEKQKLVPSNKEIKYQSNLAKLGIGILFIMGIFFFLANMNGPITFEIKKANLNFLNSASKESCNSKISNFKPEILDTCAPINKNEQVLVIGDSQLEGLREPIYKYCINNYRTLVQLTLQIQSSSIQPFIYFQF